MNLQRSDSRKLIVAEGVRQHRRNVNKGTSGSRRHCFCVFVCLLFCVLLLRPCQPCTFMPRRMERCTHRVGADRAWASSKVRTVASGARTQCPSIRGSATRSRTSSATPELRESPSYQSSKFGSRVGGARTRGFDGEDGPPEFSGLRMQRRRAARMKVIRLEKALEVLQDSGPEIEGLKNALKKARESARSSSLC